jgi:3-hydroxybutyryl-CoA dehydrogenase
MSSESSSITIVGLGLMGAQIAQVFAQTGFSVRAYDVSPQQLQSGLDLIKYGRYGLSKSVERGRLSQEKADEALSRITTFISLAEALRESDLVLEAAIENIETKQTIFKSAESFAKNSAALCTNTSTLSISKISEPFDIETKRRIVGMHFFNPPQVMKLIEIVRTKETGENSLSAVTEVTKKIGKIPISVFDSPGFVANRIGISVFAEASSLLENGIASVRDIDLAMRLGYGYPLGPFELGDLVGLDSRLRNMESLYTQTGDQRFKPPEILKKLVEEGYLGDPKTKKGSRGGYYEYFGLKKPSEDS